jgi:hypothetical protein
MSVRLALALLSVLALTACAQDTVRQQPRYEQTAAIPTGRMTQKFAEAGDGTVIPDFKPDPEAQAFAQRCTGGGGGSVDLGMSECSLIGAKGTPSRVVGGLDQSGHAHDAIWYVEGGVRTVYKFNDDKLIEVIH